MNPMNEWYFAKDGQQEGPVTEQQIIALVSAGALDPASALVWREGLSDWKFLAESGILPATGAVGPVTAMTTAENPYLVTERTRNSLSETPREVNAEYPGYGRLRYFLSTIVITVVFYGILFALVFASLSGNGSGGGSAAGMLLIVLLMIVSSVYIGLQRLKNLGMSGWAILWALVPFMNIWIAWRMMACPAGYEDHRTMDTAAKVITGLWVGLLVLSIGGNIIAAVMGGR